MIRTTRKHIMSHIFNEQDGWAECGESRTLRSYGGEDREVQPIRIGSTSLREKQA